MHGRNVNHVNRPEKGSVDDAMRPRAKSAGFLHTAFDLTRHLHLHVPPVPLPTVRHPEVVAVLRLGEALLNFNSMKSATMNLIWKSFLHHVLFDKAMLSMIPRPTTQQPQGTLSLSSGPPPMYHRPFYNPCPTTARCTMIHRYFSNYLRIGRRWFPMRI